MPGSSSRALQGPAVAPIGAGIWDLGASIYPGGSQAIVTNSLANPTLVTTLAPHGLVTGDTIFWTSSAVSVPLLTVTPQQVVTRVSPTTFTNPVNCTTGGTSGGYDIAILAVPLTAAGVPATFLCGAAHGLRPGDSITITATGAVSAVGTIDGVNTVTAVSADGRSFTVGACTNVTTAGSATAGHFSKTTYYSEVWDAGLGHNWEVGVVLTSVIGTTPSTLIDIQGSLDYNPVTFAGNWYNLPYAVKTAPQTLVVAQLTVTTATTTVYKIAGPGEANYFPYRYLRFACSTSANVIMSFTLTALPTA